MTGRPKQKYCGKQLLFLLILPLAAMINLISLPAQAFDPGKDGNLVVNNGEDIAVNPVAVLLHQNASAGANQVRQDPGGSNVLGLEVGDLIMIYQAQGATITTNNDWDYGTIIDLNGAGNYEIASVTSVPIFTGPEADRGFIGISTECGGLQNSYDISQGAVQIIRIPQYSNVTVNSGGTIRPVAWNGSTGGIVAMHVAGTLTVNTGGSINASGRGFRGGVFLNSDSPNGRTEYSTLNPDFGAAKGESIAGIRDERGRGAPANGGGGGVSHNSGGGGGANAGDPANWTIGSPAVNGGQGVMAPGPADAWLVAWALESPVWAQNGNQPTNSSGGGRGGYSWTMQALDPTVVPPGDIAWGDLNGPTQWTGDRRRPIGGLGGRPLVNNPQGRLFFGGGGGAGHANNNVPAGGGAGGGLIFIMANEVEGGGIIHSDGANGIGTAAHPNNTAHDAPGGAGAGGTIVLRANQTADTITLRANGGTGGNQFWSAPGGYTESEGPGGGGGGGYIAMSGTGSPTRIANGGSSGLNNRDYLEPFPPNGATNGGVGQANEVATLLNFCQGTISGRVFADLNGDGNDAGDPGIANVPVLITPAVGAPFTVFTDADGRYSALVPFGSTTALVDDSSSEIPPGSVPTTGVAPSYNFSQTLNVNGQSDFATTPVGFQQREPQMELSESVNIGGVGSGTTYSYTITYSNNATPSELAYAQNVVITSQLPNIDGFESGNLQVRFLNGSITSGPTGTIVHDGNGLVTITLDGNILPGQGGTILLTVKTYDDEDVPNAATPFLTDGFLRHSVALNGESHDGTPITELTDFSILEVSQPLLVDLLSFHVSRDLETNLLTITWVTGAEWGTAGFDVYRVTAEKQLVRVNDEIINPLGSPVEGATYSLVDPIPFEEGQNRSYLLVETEFSGDTNTYGPAHFPPVIVSDTPVIDWMDFGQ